MLCNRCIYVSMCFSLTVSLCFVTYIYRVCCMYTSMKYVTYMYSACYIHAQFLLCTFYVMCTHYLFMLYLYVHVQHMLYICIMYVTCRHPRKYLLKHLNSKSYSFLLYCLYMSSKFLAFYATEDCLNTA